MEVGELVGAYCILKELGVGGMGAVYLAEHKLLGRRAAIKVLLPRLSVDQPSVERFFQEARAVSAIKNPGIVEVYDFGYHETRGARRAYIVMELLEGESMTRRIARLHRLGVAEGMRFARQICMSLGAAHAKGIVHRDLKPENLFIVPRSE